MHVKCGRTMQQEVRQPVVLKRLHLQGRGTGRCGGPSVSTWPPRCICSLSSDPCWWARTSSSLPGSEESTGGPASIPDRRIYNSIQTCSHYTLPKHIQEFNFRGKTFNLVLEHVHVVVCCLWLLLCHLL